MSDILSRWLNQELRLSKIVDPRTFAKDFSNGYLFGEVLHKYQMQNDFSMFLKKDTAISKVNNFTRLQPTLRLLGISFDINTAQDLMDEKLSVATHILYQLYGALENKKNSGISRTMMEMMQPAAKANLHKKEHEILSHRLPQVVKRDIETKLQKVSQDNRVKFQQLTNTSVVTEDIQQKKDLKVQDVKRTDNKKARQTSESKKVFHAHKRFTGVKYDLGLKAPKLASSTKKQQHKERRAQIIQAEISLFETNKKKLVTSDFGLSSSQSLPSGITIDGSKQDYEVSVGGTKLMLQSNSKYIQEIRQRLKENAVIHDQRQKRIDLFLVEQFKARQAEQDIQRDEQLVKRLTRQSKHEQRLAVQLMQIRKQKDVIVANYLVREQQIQLRREKDFQESLHREAILTQQSKLAREEEIRKELEFCERIAAEKAQRRHKKHFDICKDIVTQIVDLATKVGEHRLLTGNLIPAKLLRQWKDLLFRGLPLYESTESQQPDLESSALQDPIRLKKEETLNNLDYNEYTSMVGEWAWPEEAEEEKLPPSANNILGHIIQRLEKIAHPPVVETSSAFFSNFAIKACVLGKCCTGKTTCLSKIAEALGICVLSADTLVTEALQANKKENDNSEISLATLGAAAEKEMSTGHSIQNEQLVDIMVEAISHVPTEAGWILDGFPYDINLAHLLEKALGGSVDEGSEVLNDWKIVEDPNSSSPAPTPSPVLDLVILLDIPDECVVRRAYSHLDDLETDAAATSLHPKDKILYKAQIPHRISAFQDNWPALEKWFGEKQNILVCIDADIDEDELYSKVKSVLQRVLQEKQKAPSSPPVEDVVNDSTKNADTSVTPTPDENQHPNLSEQEVDSTESQSCLKKEEVEVVTSGKESPSSLSNKESEEVPQESSSSEKTSGSHACVEQALPPEIAEHLYSYWDTMCDSYTNYVKKVMQQMRLQQEVIDHQLFNIREGYKHFIGRPDLKQELVSEWQKDFNNIPDDMREDEDTKAELHLRLDELCERLWDISDKRKEEDEQERDALMCEGWLEDHAIILINHHSILMQAELSRFQQTLYILKVYYWSMQGDVPLERPSIFSCIPLLENHEIKDQDESTPFHRQPDSQQLTNQAKAEPEKLSDEKIISDYEESIKVISELVSAEAQERMTDQQKEMEEKKKAENAATSAKKGNNEKQPSKKQKDSEKPQINTEKSPANVEQAHNQERGEKIHQENLAVLYQEENAVKRRIELVKNHGLMMVQALQSRAQETFSKMEKWFQARYLTEMTCIDQFSKMVRQCIEAGNKLQYEVVLDGSDFYLNGDCLFAKDLPPPPRPPPLEKPLPSTPKITQLESLHRQLYTIAPAGLMSTSEFSSLLKDLVSVNMGRDTLPVLWMSMNTTQLLEIVSLLTDEYKLIDWRQFLLSAALPWPFPSLTQLLDVLRRLKEADVDNTGYVDEEQYLEIQLWFSNEITQTVPEDPSEPLPYNRLAYLSKFFFQLFANHTVSPPRLDYLSMLQYFAADPDPRQGFIRALSVVLGKCLTQPSQGHLIKSMPSIEEATEIPFLEVNRDLKEDDTQSASSSFLWEQGVSIPLLLKVVCHKVTKLKDSSNLPPGCLSQEEYTEHLAHIYTELGYEPDDYVPFSILARHPHIQTLMETSTQCKLVNIHKVLLAGLDE
ncbi:sperm flagellar protein 2 [Menidia menidia]